VKRPQYESEQDRHNEAQIARRIEAAWSVTLHKLPKSYAMDFAATRHGDVVGWIEVKRRTLRPSYTYIMLSVGKWRDGNALAATTSIGWVFVVEEAESGTLWWLDCSDLVERGVEFDIAWGGRTNDTRDPADVEPVVHLPRAEFRRLDKFTRSDLASIGVVG